MGARGGGAHEVGRLPLQLAAIPIRVELPLQVRLAAREASSETTPHPRHLLRQRDALRLHEDGLGGPRVGITEGVDLAPLKSIPCRRSGVEPTICEALSRVP